MLERQTPFTHGQCTSARPEEIVNCEQLINELQRVVEIFDVDLNLYNRYVKAIDREIGLIKRWRQRDMAIKSRLEKGNI
jgi:hypothetical protein